MHYGDSVLNDVISETIAGDFAMLLGRVTYDIFAGYWPQHDDDPIGKAFNKATKYVVTHRAEGLDWAHTQRISGDAVAELQRLKETEGPELHVWGSGVLMHTLMAAGLVDEYRMWIVPVVLGEGQRLFGNGVQPVGLQLVSTMRTSMGVLINTYRPAGDVGEG